MSKGFPLWGKDTGLAHEKGQGTRANGSPSLQRSPFSSLTNTTYTRFLPAYSIWEEGETSRYMGFDSTIPVDALVGDTREPVN